MIKPLYMAREMTLNEHLASRRYGFVWLDFRVSVFSTFILGTPEASEEGYPVLPFFVLSTLFLFKSFFAIHTFEFKDIRLIKFRLQHAFPPTQPQGLPKHHRACSLERWGYQIGNDQFGTPSFAQRRHQTNGVRNVGCLVLDVDETWDEEWLNPNGESKNPRIFLLDQQKNEVNPSCSIFRVLKFLEKQLIAGWLCIRKFDFSRCGFLWRLVYGPTFSTHHLLNPKTTNAHTHTQTQTPSRLVVFFRKKIIQWNWEDREIHVDCGGGDLPALQGCTFPVTFYQTNHFLLDTCTHRRETNEKNTQHHFCGVWKNGGDDFDRYFYAHYIEPSFSLVFLKWRSIVICLGSFIGASESVHWVF